MTGLVSSGLGWDQWRALKADSHIACPSHAAPMLFPCHAMPLSVYNVSFPFDLHSAAVSDSHLPCHAPTMPFFSRPQHGRRKTAVLCCGLEKNVKVGAWHGHGMTSVSETPSHCVNQMGKTHSKPLEARHGRNCVGAAWERHAMCESASMNKIMNFLPS